MSLRGKISWKFSKLVGICWSGTSRVPETSWTALVHFLHRPRDPSSLGVTRALFGLAMALDIPEERGGATLERRWGDPRGCHFPLFTFLQPAPLPWMAFIYAIMWIGSVGVALGYKFRLSALMFALPYWYILLIEKSFWNNHSYLFGLVGLLLLTTQANQYLSLDAFLDPSLQDQPVPQWNYTLLKFQFVILYFLAGVKKGSTEWLSGYAMTDLGTHWIFDPFKVFLATEQIDYLLVHWFAFLFDLTFVFWMCWRRTKTLATLFCVAFHFMNSRLFRIGMFPWVCLATLPLFYSEDWPKRVLSKLRTFLVFYSRFYVVTVKENNEQPIVDTDIDGTRHDIAPGSKDLDELTNNSVSDNNEIKERMAEGDNETRKGACKRNLVTCLIIMYMVLQAFLPFSHFITKGYNNWTNGLYGYSWDMMVHSWDQLTVVVKVVDNENGNIHFLEPGTWTPNDRWTRHGDMVYQYAHCIQRNILAEIDDNETCASSSAAGEAISEWRSSVNYTTAQPGIRISRNISVFVDVWCSLNGRFQQRMWDPRVDLVSAVWSPLQSVTWRMPLVPGADSWRHQLAEIRARVHSWSNHTDVMLLADFPGYHLDNYIAPELSNVTLTVLHGIVAYEPPVSASRYRHLGTGQSLLLEAGESVSVLPGQIHKVHSIGQTPSYYMYTFANSSKYIENKDEHIDWTDKLPVWKELTDRVKNMLIFFKLVGSNFMRLLFVKYWCR